MKLQESINKLKEIREVAKTYGVVTISEGDSKAIDTVVAFYEEKVQNDKVDFLKSAKEPNGITHPYDLSK